MKVIGDAVDGGKVCVGNGDAFGVVAAIEAAANGEAGLGSGSADQLEKDLMADERGCSPVLGDEREEPMLDLVPFGGAGRQMADDQGEADLVGELLQLGLPQPAAIAVAAAAVGGDDEAGCLEIAGVAHLMPPAADRIDRKGG